MAIKYDEFYVNYFAKRGGRGECKSYGQLAAVKNQNFVYFSDFVFELSPNYQQTDNQKILSVQAQKI
jgi:hypothetical protein